MKDECKILDKKYRNNDGFAGVGYDHEKISLYIVSKDLHNFDIDPDINGIPIQIIELKSMPSFA